MVPKFDGAFLTSFPCATTLTFRVSSRPVLAVRQSAKDALGVHLSGPVEQSAGPSIPENVLKMVRCLAAGRKFNPF